MAVDLRGPAMRLKLADDETEIDLEALQGLWSVEQYLKLTNQTNRLIEFTDGVIEILPTPANIIKQYPVFSFSPCLRSRNGLAAMCSTRRYALKCERESFVSRTYCLS